MYIGVTPALGLLQSAVFPTAVHSHVHRNLDDVTIYPVPNVPITGPIGAGTTILPVIWTKTIEITKTIMQTAGTATPLTASVAKAQASPMVVAPRPMPTEWAKGADQLNNPRYSPSLVPLTPSIYALPSSFRTNSPFKAPVNPTMRSIPFPPKDPDGHYPTGTELVPIDSAIIQSFLEKASKSLAAQARSTKAAQKRTAVPTATLVYKFPQPSSWVENIAARPNGKLLLSLYDRPELYELDPSVAKPEPTLVRRIAPEGKLGGIAQIGTNEYAVLASRTEKDVENVEVWTVNCGESCVGTTGNVTGAANVSKAGGPYPAKEVIGPLNGMTGISETPSSTVLASDTANGLVIRFELPGNKATVVLNDTTMSPGINGIHVLGNVLYFSNTVAGLFARVPLTTGKPGNPTGKTESGLPYENIAAGPVEVLAKDLEGIDDFAISPKRDMAYIANFGGNEVLKVNLKDKTVSKEVVVPGAPTAVQFGTGKVDKDVIYVTTMSGELYSHRIAA